MFRQSVTQYILWQFPTQELKASRLDLVYIGAKEALLVVGRIQLLFELLCDSLWLCADGNSTLLTTDSPILNRHDAATQSTTRRIFSSNTQCMRYQLQWTEICGPLYEHFLQGYRMLLNSRFIKLKFCAYFQSLFHLQEGRDDFVMFLFFLGKRFISFSGQHISFHPSVLSSRNLLWNITEECPFFYSRFLNNSFVALYIPLVVYTQVWRVEIYSLHLLERGFTSIDQICDIAVIRMCK